MPEIDWGKYPKRKCHTLHECRLCGEDIKLGDEYRDGGHGRRAHVWCVSASDLGWSRTWRRAKR